MLQVFRVFACLLSSPVAVFSNMQTKPIWFCSCFYSILFQKGFGRLSWDKMGIEFVYLNRLRFPSGNSSHLRTPSFASLVIMLQNCMLTVNGSPTLTLQLALGIHFWNQFLHHPLLSFFGLQATKNPSGFFWMKLSQKMHSGLPPPLVMQSTELAWRKSKVKSPEMQTVDIGSSVLRLSLCRAIPIAQHNVDKYKFLLMNEL